MLQLVVADWIHHETFHLGIGACGDGAVVDRCVVVHFFSLHSQVLICFQSHGLVCAGPSCLNELVYLRICDEAAVVGQAAGVPAHPDDGQGGDHAPLPQGVPIRDCKKDYICKLKDGDSVVVLKKDDWRNEMLLMQDVDFEGGQGFKTGFYARENGWIL